MLNTQQPYNISNTLDDSLENYIIKNISVIPEVELVRVSKIADDYYGITTVINKLDRNVRESIYNIEYSIMNHFKDLNADFHVICRNGRDIKDMF